MIDMEDKTGQPRDEQEILEALRAVQETLIKHAIVLPLITVHAGIIMDCLRECLDRRGKEELHG